MKWYKPPIYQVAGFLLSMPFIAWALSSVLYGREWYHQWKVWAIAFPLLFAAGAVSWYLHYQYTERVRRRFPLLTQTRKRILLIVLIFLAVMTPSVLIIFFLFDHFSVVGYKVNNNDLKMGLLVGFIVNILFETLWEVLYIINKYKENLAENETLEQMSISQEFENLKGQVNPHFLFNCFNTLSSLITEDRTEAEKFLDELSKVYRYLLKNNEAGMATLATELKFIQSYYRLLKTRHGEALQLQTEIDVKYHSYLLPSLSLQLLVENAVKHNVVSRHQPLMIEIFTTTANQLVVNNNLQCKLKKETSTHIGLKNIAAKYKLLQQNGFQVVEGEKNYMVVLPLIWNNNLIHKQ